MMQFLFLRCEVQGNPQRIWLKSPKLKTGYRYENQFWNPGFTNGFTQFCRYRYFCFEILYYLVSSYFTIFFESLKSKSTQIIRPKKGNSGVSFNDILLKELSLCHKSQFSNTYISKNGVNLWYFKLWLFDPSEFIVWNIKGLQHWVVELMRLKIIVCGNDSIPFGLWDDCTKSLPYHLVKLK